MSVYAASPAAAQESTLFYHPGRYISLFRLIWLICSQQHLANFFHLLGKDHKLFTSLPVFKSSPQLKEWIENVYPSALAEVASEQKRFEEKLADSSLNPQLVDLLREQHAAQEAFKSRILARTASFSPTKLKGMFLQRVRIS